MNKKLIVSLSIGLVILVFMTIFLPLLLRQKEKKIIDQGTDRTGKATGLTTSEDANNKESLTKILHDDSDFTIIYSPASGNYSAIKKTAQADQKIDDWLNKNQVNQSLSPRPTTNNNLYPNTTPIITPDSAINNTKLLTDLLSILLNAGDLTNVPTTATITPTGQVTPLISPVLTISPKKKKKDKDTLPQPSAGFVYYAQCGGSYDSYALPSGCTLCQAGCGPTTVAMIAASYVDKTITPKTIVDLYKQRGYFLGCDGSRYTDAKNALAGYGLKTTDYFISSYSSPQTIDQAASEMKNYLANGWTIFALANFCDAGCGHFFWITDVDSNNNTWAYDPYYGRLQAPPYNEKSRFPFPKYKIAFGVKK